jgi:hypothetical protein
VKYKIVKIRTGKRESLRIEIYEDGDIVFSSYDVRGYLPLSARLLKKPGVAKLKKVLSLRKRG